MPNDKIILHRVDNSEDDVVVDSTDMTRTQIKAVVIKMFAENDPKLYTVLEVPRVVS